MKSGTIFDNILVTDDEKHAEEVGKETWGATKDPEKKMKDEQDEEERKKREEEEKKRKEEEGLHLRYTKSNFHLKKVQILIPEWFNLQLFNDMSFIISQRRTKKMMTMKMMMKRVMMMMRRRYVKLPEINNILKLKTSLACI